MHFDFWLAFKFYKYIGSIISSLLAFHIFVVESKLQLGVCDHKQWWRHLVNAYEVEASMVLFAGKVPECLRCFTTRR